MKLLNKSLKSLSFSILIIVTAWSVVFYINMLDEIHDSIDDGLENYKVLIIQKANTDSTLLKKKDFDESNYAIQEISKTSALARKDRYSDTLMYMQDEDDLEPVRMLTTAFEHQGHFYELKIINSMVEEDDLIEDLFWSVFWLYLILVVSIIIINNFVLRQLWEPFYNFLGQVTKFRLGSSKALPDIVTDVREFNLLKSAVNTLLQHSLETYAHQKEFIENAAHELQTPLAIATNKLELLLEKGDMEPAQAENIGEVLQIIERLVRLNKSLLLLTKIENKQFFDKQRISLNEVIKQSLEDLEEFAAFKNIEIRVYEQAELTVEMDPTLANIVVSNLVRNAIFHNIPEGEVYIDIEMDALTISNTGKKEPLEIDKIFKRFYKSTDKTGGTGLGLAIMKAICNLYGFKVSYRYLDEKHRFEIRSNNLNKNGF
ncbi:cell wall metabolism sensor histidine kinase WalK [Olivibacter sp. XZL3]|uniref:sensor histidine kinase n=1 Tax=Olivibacter sp. XZL3 TaxID=1735116 RepID=UPI001066E798|nr:HAMP domain-containing sensor histidine kinase [Olivibacter sp. XZL3]